MKKLRKDGEYFDRLFNGSSTQDLGDLTIQCQDIYAELVNLKLKMP